MAPRTLHKSLGFFLQHSRYDLVVNLLADCMPVFRSKCRHWEFECRSLQCIPMEFLCDGYNQCDDGTDERFCGRSRYRQYLQRRRGLFEIYVCRVSSRSPSTRSKLSFLLTLIPCKLTRKEYDFQAKFPRVPEARFEQRKKAEYKEQNPVRCHALFLSSHRLRLK